MKVIFINHPVETFTATESGAIATHLWECSRVAQRDGFEPVVISGKAKSKPYPDVSAVLLDYPTIPNNRILRKFFRVQRKLSGWRHLRQKRFAKRVACVIRERGWSRNALFLHNDPETAIYLKRRFPWANIVHHFHNQIDASPSVRSRLAPSVRVISSVSNFTGRWIEKCYDLPVSSVKTIFNGVDCLRFRPCKRPIGSRVVVNFVGRTGIEKAPDLVLKAAISVAKMSKNFEVQILGSNHFGRFEIDDYQRELQSLRRQLESTGIPVRCPGHVTREALPSELAKADINVVPSRWDEPFALTILEGMACGLSSVVSRTGGAPEVVGESGLLFSRDCVAELAAHLQALITDPHLRSSYSEKGRLRAEELTWERTWAQFRDAANLVD